MDRLAQFKVGNIQGNVTQLSVRDYGDVINLFVSFSHEYLHFK